MKQQQEHNSKGNDRGNFVLIIAGLGVALFLLYSLWKFQKDKPEPSLPFLGECRLDTIHKNGSYSFDTIHHTVRDFSFVNQSGRTITQKDFEGKIYVADFFFTTCQSICPIMTGQMKRVTEAFKADKEILFLSHTVYPEQDSVIRLAEYAKEKNADTSRWQFVTGNKKELYDMARASYLLSADSGDGGKDDFVHTQMFALVDWNRHIRGFYDGTDSIDVNKLIADIKILKASSDKELKTDIK